MKKYGILIPALNPDQKLIKLVHELLNNVINFDALVLIDDGSAVTNQAVFKELEEMENSEFMFYIINIMKEKARR